MAQKLQKPLDLILPVGSGRIEPQLSAILPINGGKMGFLLACLLSRGRILRLSLAGDPKIVDQRLASLKDII